MIPCVCIDNPCNNVFAISAIQYKLTETNRKNTLQALHGTIIVPAAIRYLLHKRKTNIQQYFIICFGFFVNNSNYLLANGSASIASRHDVTSQISAYNWIKNPLAMCERSIR